MLAVIDVSEALQNWARWCRRIGDCYPEGVLGICGSAEVGLWVPYKNGDPSAQDKLDDLERRIEPDEHSAAHLERLIRQLEPLHCAAIRVHWIICPDDVRESTRRTYEQWQTIRARVLSERARLVSADQYQEAVDAATEQLEEMLCLWARAA